MKDNNVIEKPVAAYSIVNTWCLMALDHPAGVRVTLPSFGEAVSKRHHFYALKSRRKNRANKMGAPNGEFDHLVCLIAKNANGTASLTIKSGEAAATENYNLERL